MSFRRRSGFLLLLGILAVLLHTLAAAGMLRASVAAGKGERFVAEVCTSHGLSRLDPSQSADIGSSPGTADHDCCKLCAAAGPLLAAAAAPGVPSAPTFAAAIDAYVPAPPTLVVATAHPPRGPPARG